MVLSNSRFQKTSRPRFHDISINQLSNIDNDTVQILVSKLIDSNAITVKETKQGQEPLYLKKDATIIPTKHNTYSICSNDESEDTTQVESSDIN